METIRVFKWVCVNNQVRLGLDWDGEKNQTVADRLYMGWSFARLRLRGIPLRLAAMVVTKTLRAAVGWLELGLADEALNELDSLPLEAQGEREALEVKLVAQMDCQLWNHASETARLLCLKAKDEAEFFIKAAFCLHETGDTLAACNQLLSGPKSLFEMAIFHYNLACYLWVLGEGNRARGHLKQAIEMDGSFLEAAREDRDLAGIGPMT